MEADQPGTYRMGNPLLSHSDAVRSVERRQAPSRPVTFVLDEEGRIIACGMCGERLLGFEHGELDHRHICHIFPQLTEHEFMLQGQVNPRFVNLSHSGFQFKTRNHRCRVFGCTLDFTEFVTHGSIRTVSLVAYPSR